MSPEQQVGEAVLAFLDKGGSGQVLVEEYGAGVLYIFHVGESDEPVRIERKRPPSVILTLDNGSGDH